jgi:sialic acid synthase SpsE
VDSRQFRRRLVYTEDVNAGDLITDSNTRTARCSEGIYPVRLEADMMIADVDAKAGDPVT